MTTEGVYDYQKDVRKYIVVFAALAALTLITVAVSYLHLEIIAAVTLALVIASIKGSLVACYFMHLISEKRLIYIVLILTVVFFLGLLLLPLAGHWDAQVGIKFTGHSEQHPADHH